MRLIQSGKRVIRGFTLVEMLIVLSIIALLAGLTMGGYTYAMRSSKRRLTTGTFEAVKSALENYRTEFGEYPEPATEGTKVEFLPNKAYDISGAACLYQALSGDGFDQIKGVTAGDSQTSGTSDGKTEGEEIKNITLKEMPQTMWRRMGQSFVLVDGFGRPFQYIKAAAITPTGGGASGGGSNSSQPTTINSTYDLWSYAEDEVNISKRSTDTLENQQLSQRWIKNW
jgi:prepilin-type N-terminal cleavage/methylation domain-containing protein